MKTCFASNWTSRFRSEKNDFRNFIRSRDVLHLNLLLHFLDLCSTFCLGVLESSSFVLWNWNAEKVWKDDNNLRLITSRWPWTSFHSLPGLSNPQNVQINRHQDGKIEAWDSCWIIPRNVRSDDVCIIDHNWWQMRMSDKWHLTSSICKSSASHQVFLWWLVSFFFRWRQVVTRGDKSWHVKNYIMTVLWQFCPSPLVCRRPGFVKKKVTEVRKSRTENTVTNQISGDEFPVNFPWWKIHLDFGTPWIPSCRRVADPISSRPGPNTSWIPQSATNRRKTKQRRRKGNTKSAISKRYQDMYFSNVSKKK